MNARLSLSLPEWTVLTVLSQQPAHGFAVAQLTAPGGDLGRIWQIPRPVIYRAIGRLVEAGLVRPESVEPGLGPAADHLRRYPAGPGGRGGLAGNARWSTSGTSARICCSSSPFWTGPELIPRDLLMRQRAVLEPIAQAIESGQPARGGFDAILLAWRRATATAALEFLDTIVQHESQPGPRHG